MDSAQDANVTPRRYEIVSGDALQFDVAQGERLNVESDEHYFSLVWTTALSSTSLAQYLLSSLPESEEAELMVWIGGAILEITDHVPALFQRLRELGNREDCWRLDLADYALTWGGREAATFTGMDDRAAGEIGFIGEVFDEEQITRLVGDTSTPSISSRLAEIIARCSPVISTARVS